MWKLYDDWIATVHLRLLNNLWITLINFFPKVLKVRPWQKYETHENMYTTRVRCPFNNGVRINLKSSLNSFHVSKVLCHIENNYSIFALLTCMLYKRNSPKKISSFFYIIKSYYIKSSSSHVSITVPMYIKILFKSSNWLESSIMYPIKSFAIIWEMPNALLAKKIPYTQCGEKKESSQKSETLFFHIRCIFVKSCSI